MACGSDVSRRRAFAQHLLDGISGDEVDQQEDEADHQPDDREGVEDALEDSSQLPVLGTQLSVVSRQHQLGCVSYSSSLFKHAVILSSANNFRTSIEMPNIFGRSPRTQQLD